MSDIIKKVRERELFISSFISTNDTIIFRLSEENYWGDKYLDLSIQLHSAEFSGKRLNDFNDIKKEEKIKFDEQYERKNLIRLHNIPESLFALSLAWEYLRDIFKGKHFEFRNSTRNYKIIDLDGLNHGRNSEYIFDMAIEYALKDIQIENLFAKYKDILFDKHFYQDNHPYNGFAKAAKRITEINRDIWEDHHTLSELLKKINNYYNDCKAAYKMTIVAKIKAGTNLTKREIAQYDDFVESYVVLDQIKSLLNKGSVNIKDLKKVAVDNL